METPIIGPFVSQITSLICFQFCLEEITPSQQLAQNHQ